MKTPGPLDTPPDSHTVQSCCLAYGGGSFSGPMRDALECHLSILKARYPVLAAVPALVAALELAVRYLEHPDVKALPFAMRSAHAAERARAALALAKGE